MSGQPWSVRLPAHAEARLRALWRSVRESEVPPSREVLRSVAREVSAAARSVSMLPERLVIAVKESWHGHDGFDGAEARHDARWVLTELISLCIREYYLAARSRRPDAPSAFQGGASAPAQLDVRHGAMG